MDGSWNGDKFVKVNQLCQDRPHQLYPGLSSRFELVPGKWLENLSGKEQLLCALPCPAFAWTAVERPDKMYRFRLHATIRSNR